MFNYDKKQSNIDPEISDNIIQFLLAVLAVVDEQTQKQGGGERDDTS